MSETTNQSCATGHCLPIQASLSKRLIGGVIGGLVGGLVYSYFMVKMGMFPMLASMMGSSSAVVGFMMHMMVSVIFGLGIGLLLPLIPSCPGKTMMAGAVYGAILWVIGPMLMMPLMMGMPIFNYNPVMGESLFWHMVFAIVALFVARLFVTVCKH